MELFKKNLEFLARNLPELHNIFTNLKPLNVLPDDSLVNDIQVDNEPFYGMDGKVACRMQTEHFFAYPTHFSLTYRSQPTNGYLHQVAINRLNQKAQDLDYKTGKKPYVTNLLVLGSGLGFYFNSILSQLNCKNILLVEPTDEMLLQFLHHTDLAFLHQHCIGNGGTLSIIQPENYQEFAGMVSHLANKTGYGIFSELTVFRHYETPLFDEILENFKALRNQWVSSWGFMNDEIQGMLHSFENARKHPLQLANKGKSQMNKALPPFVIVGNGPSLDKNIEQLKRRQNEFIIVSCGTAIGPLIRSGIKPDFHAEMERSNFTAQVQEKWFSQDFCQSTILLALNTVSPKITHKFPQTLLFAKGFDIGTHLLQKGLSKALNPLMYCNPTVTNFATAAALFLNAKNIIFLGCDFGFKDIEKHHSEKSDYYQQHSQLEQVKPTSDLQVPDNNNALVYTSRVLNLTRQNIEKLITIHSTVKFINCSDGAKINGAAQQDFSQICGEDLQKSKRLSVFLSNLDSALVTLNRHQLNEMLEHYAHTATALKNILKEDISDAKLEASFQKMMAFLTEKNQMENENILFGGSIKYLAVCTAGHLARIAPSVRKSYCDFAMAEISNMLDRANTKLIKFTNGEKT